MEFNSNCEALCHYAQTFYGFGSWRADYWLIGLEEFGCTKSSDEFTKRYSSWKKNRGRELVDLKNFFSDCQIEETPDWANATWQWLHRLCRHAGLFANGLCEHNRHWGGNRKVRRNSGHVALIEATPFPAPSQNGSDWPYRQFWKKFRFMENSKRARDKFLSARLERIQNRFYKYRPKLVIFYGKLPVGDHFFAWKSLGKKCGEYAIAGKSLICRINHPAWLRRFGGDPVTEKLAAKIHRVVT